MNAYLTELIETEQLRQFQTRARAELALRHIELIDNGDDSLSPEVKEILKVKLN